MEGRGHGEKQSDHESKGARASFFSCGGGVVQYSVFKWTLPLLNAENRFAASVLS